MAIENQSSVDPTRKTVGAIYVDAQKASHDPYVINADLTHELQKSLVDDLNETIKSMPYEGRAFYILVHEHKDMTMPRAIRRNLYTMLYRPYPEDDTLVFWADPKSNEVRFCWCLPHHSEMDNILINSHLYDNDLVQSIKAWKRFDFEHFGFMKDEKGMWKGNPNYKDQLLQKHKPRIFTSNYA